MKQSILKVLTMIGLSKTDAQQTESTEKTSNDYFDQAISWSDERFLNANVTKNRYQLAFLVSMGLCVVLAMSMMLLSYRYHEKQIEPIAIHYFNDGRVLVEPAKQLPLSPNNTMIESDIIRYVMEREGYYPDSYQHQYTLVHHLSNATTAEQYSQTQSDTHSPIQILGTQGTRTVHVDNIIFVDQAIENESNPRLRGANLAHVNFTVTDQLPGDTRHTVKSYTSIVSWQYKGAPTTPTLRWQNWNGFQVTRYTRQPRQLTVSNTVSN